MNRMDGDKKEKTIPFWRDVRMLGVFGQVAFVVLVILLFRTLGSNFIDNIGKLGKAQFICRDGSYSLRCAFDFLETEAGFEIAETEIDYDVRDSYFQAIRVGLLNTVKVSLLAIFFSTILGVVTGVARLSKNWLVSGLAKWYIEIIRNTPLLVQIVFIYFVFFLSLPKVSQSLQPLGLPLYASQRSINLPELVFMPSSIWILLFGLVGVIQMQLIYGWLKRKESKSGKPAHPLAWGLAGLVLIVVVGAWASGRIESSEGILTPKATRIRDPNDFETLVLSRAGVDHISALKDLPTETLERVAIRICTTNHSNSEYNLIHFLEGRGLPFLVTTRSQYAYQAAASYQSEECDVLAAPLAVLAGERSGLEKPGNHILVSIPEASIQWSIPRRDQGGGIAGGNEITPEFAALLIGLTVYAGAFIAEIVRAGIQSVPRGQSEAATALGLNDWQKLRMVIMPQALRVIIPPLISEYLGTIKDSSLGIAIGYPDLYNVSYTTINQSGRSLQVILIVMATYLAMSLITSGLLNWYNAKIRFVEK